MEKELPYLEENASIAVTGQHQWIRIFLDKTLLTEYTSKDSGPNPGIKFTSVALPKEYAGKKIRIAISSPYKTFAGNPAPVYIGEQNKLNAYFFSSAVPQLLVLSLAVFLGLILLVYTGVNLRQTKEIDYASIVLCLFAFTLGFKSIVDDQLAGLVFSPLLHSTLANTLTMLVPFFLGIYYWLKMSYYRKPYSIWIIISSLTVTISLILDVIGLYDLPEMMSIVNSIFIIGPLVTSLAAIGEAYRHNRFYVICTSGIVAGAIIHCFFFMQSALGMYNAMINWSAVIYIALMLLFCGYSIQESFKKADQVKRRLQFLQLKTMLLEEDHTSLVSYLNDTQQLREQQAANLQYMKQMIEDKDYSQLRQHVEDLITDDTEHKRLTHFCSNEMLNLILQHYQKKARQRSIDATFIVELDGKIPMSEPDLLSLLETVLDKAIKETCKVDDPRQRKLNLHILVEDGKIDIHCENTSYLIDNIFEQRIDTSEEPDRLTDVHLIKTITDRYKSKCSYESSEKINRLSIQVSE